MKTHPSPPCCPSPFASPHRLPVIASILFAAATPVRADFQYRIWTGNDGSWLDAANWNPALVPNGATDEYPLLDGGIAHVSGTAATGWWPTIGNNTAGALSIENGGIFTSAAATVGDRVASNGTVTVTGAGSVWNLTSNTQMDVGLRGTGTVSVQNGGKINSYGVALGRFAGAQGTATITGAGSVWAPTYFSVGQAGGGTLNITNGGSLTTSTELLIGNLAGSTGQATISGTGSSLHVSTDYALDIGLRGSGTLTVENGATGTSGYVDVADSPGSQGTFTLTGAGTSWSSTSNVVVGLGGTGTLNILDGASLTAVGMGLGAGAGGSQGTLKVSGPGSSLHLSTNDSLIAGGNGTSTVTVENGGSVTAGSTFLSGVSGTMTITGAQSSWSATSFTVADIGTNTLNVLNGASLTAGDMILGTGASAQGILKVSGSGSNLHTSSFTGGSQGTSTITVENGGSVIAGSTALRGVSGTMTITGAQSSWSATSFIVAEDGNNTLNILNGGSLVAASSFTVGVLSGAGSVTVSGAGSVLQVQDSFPYNTVIGNLGTGSLTVADQGTASFSSPVLAYAPSSSGILYLNGTAGSRGVIEAKMITEGDGSGSVVFDGGILRPTAVNGNFLGGFEAGDVTFLSGGGFIDTNGFDTGILNVLSGAGGLTKLGSGQLSPLAANTYLGGTTISGGVLAVTSDSNLGAASGGIALAGGTLKISSAGYASTSRAISLASGGGGIDTANTFTLNQSVTGTGTLTKLGAGTLRLGNSVTLPDHVGLDIAAGTLDLNGASVSASSLSGNGTLAHGSAHFVLDQSGFTAFAGAITGGGPFTKLGTGSFSLTVPNTYGTLSANGGTLAVSSTLTTAGVHIGENGYSGIVDVNGTLNAGPFLTVGDNTGAPTPGGTGILTIGGGGLVTLDAGAKLTVGWVNANGTVNLNPGGTLQIGGTDGIQKDATGTSNFKLAGGTLKVVNSDLSTSVPMSVSGTGSTFDTNGLNAILNGALNGSGALRKIGTVTLTLNGGNSNSAGAVTVDGGRLQLSNGGQLNTAGLHIGMAGGNGTVRVLNNNSVLNAGGFLTVGDNATGTGPGGTGNLFIGAGSTVPLDTGARLTVGWVNATGTVTLGGTLQVGGVDGIQKHATGTADFTLADGTIQVTGSDLTTSLPMTLSGTVSTIDTNGLSATLSGSLSGSGSLTKAGAGTLTLSGAHPFSGGTTVAQGTLQLNAATLSGGIQVSTGGTLWGRGTANGISFPVNPATVAPGAGGPSGIGTLTSTSVINLTTNTLTLMEIASLTSFDKLVAAAQFAFGGELRLTVSGGYVPAVGSTYDLFDFATRSGTFNKGITFTNPGYAGTMNYATGVLTITSVPGGDNDSDGRNNLLEYATDGNPNSGTDDGKIAQQTVTIAGNNYLALTLPIRTGATFTGTGEKVSTPVDGIIYRIQGSTDLANWTTTPVTEVTPAQTAGLPALNPGWEYRTFRLGSQARGFLRAAIEAAP